MDEETVDAALEDVVAGPRRAQGDMGSVENHPIPDLIALKKFYGAQEAFEDRAPKLLINRLRPPPAA